MWGRSLSIVSLAFALALLSAGRASLSGQQVSSSPPVSETHYVGAATCARCHQTIHETWTGGRHSKMIQPATSGSVQGDFLAGTLVLNGRRYRLRVENGRYFITESYLTGREREHQVQYTLGSRRIQHYLATVENGRIIVLPPSWDVQRREWFDNADIIGDTARSERELKLVQQWNRNCFGCHVSRQQNNYDPATRSYVTQWMDYGTGCERCHGDGSRHVQRYSQPGVRATAGDPQIVRPTALDPVRSSMICAQCHSLRDVVAPAFAAGADYYDHFMPLLEFGSRRDSDPAYWADGRPRRFANDAIGLWQSECFLRGGATCTTCHVDPHQPDVDRDARVAPTNNALCTKCHQDIGARTSAHTRHEIGSAGSSCVECHMPKDVMSIKATMRDHTIGLPAPESTLRFAIPNACNGCHQDRDAAWAAAAARAWWPENRRGKHVARARIFMSARSGSMAVVSELAALAADSTASPFVQANALGYLRTFDDPRALAALRTGLESPHPAVRAVAAGGLGERATSSADVRVRLTRALDDPTRAVRVSAFISIINAGIAVEGPDQQRFWRVSREFMARAHAHPHVDDPDSQRDLGMMHLLTREFDRAAAALEASLGLGDQTSTFPLALARIGQQRMDEARALLRRVAPTDRYYPVAVQRLQELEPAR
jgi:predicted CXXCH cytochrome family protein